MIDRDELTRRGLEQLSNVASRHRFLERAAKGVFATVAAFALGEVGIKTASANWGPCGCCTGTPCSSLGLTCDNTPGDCPAGWSLCTGTPGNPQCNGYCYYTSGFWYCTGCGPHLAYCTDCRQGSGSSCRACTCDAYTTAPTRR